MRLQLLTLVAAAALGAAFVGDLGFRSIPAAAACGGRFEDDCDFDWLDRPDSSEEQAGSGYVPILARDEVAPAADETCEPATIIDAFIPDQVRKPCDADALTTPPSQQDMNSHWWDVDPLLVLPEELLPTCNRWDRDEAYAFGDVVQRFPSPTDASDVLQHLGWRAGAHREYTCDSLPKIGVSWLDVSAHLFTDRADASAALAYFAMARSEATQLRLAPFRVRGDATIAIAGPSEAGTEYTLYVATGPHLYRISAVASGSDPALSVGAIADALGLQPREAQHDAPIRYTFDSDGGMIALYPDGTWVPIR